MSQHSSANSFLLQPPTPSLGLFCTDNWLLSKDQPLATLKREAKGESPVQLLVWQEAQVGSCGSSSTTSPEPMESAQGQEMPLLSKQRLLFTFFYKNLFMSLHCDARGLHCYTYVFSSRDEQGLL